MELDFVAFEDAVEVARVDLDRDAAREARLDQLIFVGRKNFVAGPVPELRGNVEVADDLARQLVDRVEQRRHVQFPGFLDPDDVEDVLELGVVERPLPARPVVGVIDRQKVHGANHSVGLHRVDDILRVRPAARVVVDLGADRVVHPLAQPLGNDRGVAQLDTGRLGGAVEVAGRGEFERAPHQVDGCRIFERQVVHVVGDHHEARRAAPAGVKEP